MNITIHLVFLFQVLFYFYVCSIHFLKHPKLHTALLRNSLFPWKFDIFPICFESRILFVIFDVILLFLRIFIVCLQCEFGRLVFVHGYHKFTRSERQRLHDHVHQRCTKNLIFLFVNSLGIFEILNYITDILLYFLAVLDLKKEMNKTKCQR